MKIIEPKDGKRKMAELTPETINTLEQAIKTVDKTLSIELVDYSTGTINVGITYNRGTANEWTNKEFIPVNVNGDSVAAAFHDVYTAAYDRCI